MSIKKEICKKVKNHFELKLSALLEQTRLLDGRRRRRLMHRRFDEGTDVAFLNDICDGRCDRILRTVISVGVVEQNVVVMIGL